MEYIIVCACGGQVSRAQAAYQVLFPGKPLPETVRGRGNIEQLANQHPKTNLHDYLFAIARKGGKYSYSIRIDEDYNVVKVVDLITGDNIA